MNMLRIAAKTDFVFFDQQQHPIFRQSIMAAADAKLAAPFLNIGELYAFFISGKIDCVIGEDCRMGERHMRKFLPVYIIGYHWPASCFIYYSFIVVLSIYDSIFHIFFPAGGVC